jgi:vacuolar protein-sorting-associated protein 4
MSAEEQQKRNLDNDPAEQKRSEMEVYKQKILGTMITPERNNITWSDVAGLQEAKDALREAVILPLRQPKLFSGSRKPWTGVLLYGPPGTGKTFLAKAVASESSANFFAPTVADIASKWVGESQIIFKMLFEIAREKIKETGQPSIIFIDEIDSILATRGKENASESAEQIKTEFLTQMDGIGVDNRKLLVLGATNYPWAIDDAARRRLPKTILIPLPDTEAKLQQLQKLKEVPNELHDADLEWVAHCATNLFSGSNITTLINEVNMNPIRKLDIARQYYIDNNGKFNACKNFPNCQYCPYNLLETPVIYGSKCPFCQAIFINLNDIPEDGLVEPIITIDDVLEALNRTQPTANKKLIALYKKYYATGNYNKDDTVEGLSEYMPDPPSEECAVIPPSKIIASSAGGGEESGAGGNGAASSGVVGFLNALDSFARNVVKK